jgi:ribosomal protein L11 methyltransferase
MTELQIVCPESMVDLLVTILGDLDANSISIENANTDTPEKQLIFGEPEPKNVDSPTKVWDICLLKALFIDTKQAKKVEILVRERVPNKPYQILGLVEIPTKDWVKETQFGSIAITPDVWIVPSWQEAPPKAKTIISLDPGNAFGTGSHATTYMCLHWLAHHNIQGLSVLDYGCGSGILAIAAAKMGAKKVDAVDIDRVALTTTTDNAQKNQVSIQVCQPEAIQKRAYDIVVANILAQPLRVLAPLLCSHLKTGGYLILAGLLSEQVSLLQESYLPWLPLTPAQTREDWVLLVGQRIASTL